MKFPWLHSIEAHSGNRAPAPAPAGLSIQLSEALGKVGNLESLNGQLARQLAEATAKAGRLEGLAQQLAADITALKKKEVGLDARAREQLSAHGLNVGVPKAEPGELTGPGSDPIGLWEKYEAADPATKATMRATLGDKLTAAAAAFDRFNQ